MKAIDLVRVKYFMSCLVLALVGSPTLAGIPSSFEAEAVVTSGFGSEACVATCIASCGRSGLEGFFVGAQVVQGLGNTSTEAYNNAKARCQTLQFKSCQLDDHWNTPVQVDLVDEYTLGSRRSDMGATSPNVILRKSLTSVDSCN